MFGLILVGMMLVPHVRLWGQATVLTLSSGSLSAPYYGYVDGNTFSASEFSGPMGMALDPSGTVVLIADYTNNAIRMVSHVGNIASSVTSTLINATNSGAIPLSHPVAVAVDGATNIFVLSRGAGTNGAILHFGGVTMNSGSAKVYAPVTTGLSNATAMTMDGWDNLYLTVRSNQVVRVATNGTITRLGSISQAGASLQGIAMLDNGQLALADAGNNGIWIMDPLTGVSVKFTGFNGAGDTLGDSTTAAFNGLAMMAKAGGGVLVVADRGNHKVKLVDGSGTVSLLYGVSSNLWLNYTGFPGWQDGTAGADQGDVESRLPTGVLVGTDGNVYVTEDYYHIFRRATGTGLAGPSVSYPQTFSGLAGIAYDSIDNYLFIADATNNAVELMDLSRPTNAISRFLDALDGVTNPVAVQVDTNDFIYVLNRGTTGTGSILAFDINGNSWGAVATNLNQPTAFTVDDYGNFFVTEQAGNIRSFGPTMPATVLATITNANVSLQGIALFDDGTIAVSDAGNHVIWTVNSLTKLITRLTGQLGTNGTAVGASNVAKLCQPHQLCRVNGNQLVGADFGNNRLVLISRAGKVTTNSFSYTTGASLWFGNPMDPASSTSARFVPIAQPFGVAVDSRGDIFDSEVSNAAIRQITGASLAPPVINPGVPLPTYSGPGGIALNGAGTVLYVAMPTANVVSALNLASNTTTIFLTASNQLSLPVDVAMDANDDLLVLNQGSAGNGFILEFDSYGNLLATNTVGLNQPTAMAVDSADNILVAQIGGTVLEVQAGSKTLSTLAVVTNAGVQLQGIALFSDGTVVLSDAGNHVLWQIDPLTKAVTRFTGQLDAPGTTFGSASFAKLNQPHQIKLAVGDLLVAADSGNDRVVLVNRSGFISNALNSANSEIWFGLPNDPILSSSANFVPMKSPLGVAVGTSGGIFASETYYDDIRELLGTGVSRLGSGNSSSGTGTNIVVIPPTITPNSGYYPMGRTILVQSPAAQVFYTTDGTTPTTNSLAVTMNENLGYIRWSNTTNDLTELRVRAFVNWTNASTVVAGQPVATADIGVPPDFHLDNFLGAGIGSSIVVPVVCDLPTGQQVESYQFRVEIVPVNNTNTPTILPLSIVPTNDFVPLVTAAQGGVMASNTASAYTLGLTNGLQIFALGSSSHVLFKNYAVVALLEVGIPSGANLGDTYALNVLQPSATADGYNMAVTLTPMSSATVMVTNIPYLVGDSASAYGAWYDAGTFGNGDLDNSDVNQAFDAASGLRVPYRFTDVFNDMDAYPSDDTGFVGGDGQIRFLDWVTILERSLRLDPYNWTRAWSVGGYLVDFSTNLPGPVVQTVSVVNTNAPWYRQVLLGAGSVGGVAPNTTAYVPVYAKLADGSSLSGLQFRALITPVSGAPAPTGSPQFVPATGVTGPSITQNYQAGETAFGWSLGSFTFASRSSNFLGWLSFTVPTNALTGQMYQISLLNADGAPNATNQYEFETRSATVAVNTSAPPASICSDEWKSWFFGSVTNPAAADNADPDGDGVPNWREFLAGTNPTNALSRLALNGVKQAAAMQLNWTTAPGRAYAVQWTAKLAGGAWQTITTISGNGFATNCLDSNPTNATRYYRLSVLP